MVSREGSKENKRGGEGKVAIQWREGVRSVWRLEARMFAKIWRKRAR